MAGLTSEQVTAATAIARSCPTLVAIEDALDALASSFSGFERESLLLKVAAIAQLLGDASCAAASLADHAAAILAARPWSHDTVERLATLPPDLGAHRRIVFASRFAHFFLDHRRFPAIDGHLLRGLATVAPPRLSLASPYGEVAERVEAQRALITPTPPLRAVQRALSLIGQALVLPDTVAGRAARAADEVRIALKNAELRTALLGGR